MDLRKINVFKLAQKIPYDKIRNSFLDNALKLGIPFNMGMGFKIKVLTDKESQVESLPVYRRRNHLGTAHAISQALLAEYTPGVMIANKYDFHKFRLILTNLTINYHKPGTGTLTGISQAPDQWPDLKEGEMFLDMTTKIYNAKNELVADAKTTWQIKSWTKTKDKKPKS
jgi:hypothetical protein